MATFASLTPAQKTAAAQQIIASNPTYRFYNPSGLIAAAASNNTIANLITTTAAPPKTAATTPAKNILPNPATATQQSVTVNGQVYQLSPKTQTQPATWVTKAGSSAGLFPVDLTGKVTKPAPMYANQGEYAAAIASPPSAKVATQADINAQKAAEAKAAADAKAKADAAAAQAKLKADAEAKAKADAAAKAEADRKAVLEEQNRINNERIQAEAIARSQAEQAQQDKIAAEKLTQEQARAEIAASGLKLETAKTIADIDRLVSLSEKAGTPLNAGYVDRFRTIINQQEAQAQQQAQLQKTEQFNTQLSSATDQKQIDSIVAQAQAEGVTVNPASIQQAQTQIQNRQAQTDFAKTLGTPTGFTNVFGPNAQEYVSVAADPVTGQPGGWYKLVGTDLQKIDASGQATGAVIPRDQFRQMSQQAQTNFNAYQQQQQQAAAASKMTADVQKFETELAAPGGEQFQYLVANRFPVTGPDGRVYEPVPKNFTTGEPAKWVVSTQPGVSYTDTKATYRDVGAPADAPIVNKQQVNDVFNTNNEIANEFYGRLRMVNSRDQYNQLLQEAENIGLKFGQYYLDSANEHIAAQERYLAQQNQGGGGFFSALDDFINDTIGWRNIASIVGSAVIPGPWGATLGRAVAGAVAGDDLKDIAKGAALTYAATYGVQQLSNALAETAKVGAELGVEGADDLASRISNNTQVFDDGSVLITNANGVPVGGIDVGGAEFTVNNGVGVYVDSGLPLGGTPEINFGGSVTAPEAPIVPETPVAQQPIAPQQPSIPGADNTVTQVFDDGSVLTTDAVTGEPVSFTDATGAVNTVPGTPVPPGDIVYSDITGQEVDLKSTVGGEPTIRTGGPTGEVTVGPAPADVDWSQVPGIEISGVGSVPETVLPEVVVTPGADILSPEAIGGIGAVLGGGAILGGGGGAVATPPATPPAPVEPPPVETTPVEPTTPPAPPPPVETVPPTTAPVEPVPPTTTPGAPVETVPVEPGTPGVPEVELPPVTTTPPPVETPPVVPVAPPTTTPPVAPPTTPTVPIEELPPLTEPPGTPPDVNAPVNETALPEPPATPEVPVVDKSTVLTPEQVAELEKGRLPLGVSMQQLWNAVSLGLLAPSILGTLFGPKAPEKKGYGPLDPINWGATGRTLTPLGVNPGFAVGAGQQPMYQTTNPYQSQFFWGQRPGYNTMEDLAQNYNRPPGAPAQGYGLQAGPQPFDVNQYIQSLSQNMPAAPGPIAPSVPAYTPPAFPRV